MIFFPMRTMNIIRSVFRSISLRCPFGLIIWKTVDLPDLPVWHTAMPKCLLLMRTFADRDGKNKPLLHLMYENK